MIKEYHGDTLYRLEYLPTVLVPIFFALINSGTWIFAVILPIFGWCFLAVGWFLLNDIIDGDRDLQLGRKSLFLLYLLCLIFGISLIRQSGIYFALLFSVLGALYNLRLKLIPVFKNVFLVALITLPYFAFSDFTFSSNIHIFTVLALVFCGLFAEFIHSLADKDSTYQYLRNKTLPLALFTALCFFIFSVLNIILTGLFYFLLLSIIAFCGGLGLLLVWNKPEKWPTAKKIGVEVFKLFTLYLSIILFFG